MVEKAEMVLTFGKDECGETKRVHMSKSGGNMGEWDTEDKVE